MAVAALQGSEAIPEVAAETAVAACSRYMARAGEAARGASATRAVVVGWEGGEVQREAGAASAGAQRAGTKVEWMAVAWGAVKGEAEREVGATEAAVAVEGA